MTVWNRNNAGQGAVNWITNNLTGKPYVWGGENPLVGTDCSGVVQMGYHAVGIQLARSTYGQFTEFQLPHGTPLQVGDCLYIAGSDATSNEPGHVMVYVAQGKVFQACYTGGPPLGIFDYDTNVYEYVTRPALALPVPPVPPVKPGVGAPGFIQAGNKVTLLKTVNDVNLAHRNGWTLYYFGIDARFHPIFSGMPIGTSQYANIGYASPRPGI